MYPGVHAAQAPDRPAVVMAGTGARLTFGELEENSRRLAHRLREQGFRRGDVIGLLSGNDVRVFEVYWAAQRTGLYVTAINKHLSPDEIRYILEDSGAEALFVGSGIGEAATGLSTHARVRYAVAMDGFPQDGGAWHDYADELAAASAEPLADQPRGGDMLYSSGTTGRPKGITRRCPTGRSTSRATRMVGAPATAFGLRRRHGLPVARAAVPRRTAAARARRCRRWAAPWW